jgi:hypothetical protein
LLGFGGGFITAVIVAVLLVWAYARYAGPARTVVG